MILLAMLLFLLGRHLQAPTHLSDKAHDLVLSTLLSHNVSANLVDQIASGDFQMLDARSCRKLDMIRIPGAICTP